MKATNIILQGLPVDIYSLMNHHRVAKDLWERVQLLMQGTSLTKQDRECKLYDVFDKFTHIKGESLHNLPPEWSKFVTDVKLVKDFHTTNFDQLHAYLEQHKLHANESSYNNPQLQQQFPPSQYGSIHPSQHYSSTYPSQPQFNQSSVPPSYPYQSQMNHQTSYVPQIVYQSPQVATQPMTESPLEDSGFAVPVFSSGDDPIACLNKAMTFLTLIASSRFPSTNTQLKNSSNPRNQATVQDDKSQCNKFRETRSKLFWQCTQPKKPRNATWYKDKAMLTEAQEAGKILDEEQLAFLADPGGPDGQAVHTIIPNNAVFRLRILILMILTMMISRMQNRFSWVTFPTMVLTLSQSHEKMIDSQMDDMIKEKLALKEQVDSLEQNLSKQINEKECLLQTFTVFKSESKEKEDKYMENEINLEKKIKELDNIIYKVGQSTQTLHMLTKPQAFYDNIHKQALEESRSKMSEKEKDPEAIKQNISHKPIDYEKLNRLSDDFGKRFTPQQELSAEQAFWLRMSNPTSKPSNASPVKIEAPKELPEVSLMNESLKKLKFHLARFDNVVKIRTTPDARTKGEWGFEHIKAV
ncbi:hypothetical protein Tco_0743580 [Tanacetum coccineum]